MRLAVAILASALSAIAADCGALATAQTVALSGYPLKLALSDDGCWLFASLFPQGPREAPGIAVLNLAGGSLKLVRTVPVATPVTGIVLTHDQKRLIGASSGVVVLDVAGMEAGARNPVMATIPEKRTQGSFYVNVTRDDKFVFVSEEAARAITVMDAAARSIVGTVPVGNAPIALTFSSDEHWLYTTSQSAPPDWNWPAVCDPENPARGNGKHPEGAILVIDVEKARRDPAHSVAGRVRAGCNPVRLALSADGGRAYVTARKSNAVLVFDTGKLLADPEHARQATIPVGTAPVPVAASEKFVIAGNSNRFGTAAQGDQTLTVIDPVTLRTIRSIVVGLFPRDLVWSGDRRGLFVANFGSKSVQWVDLEK